MLRRAVMTGPFTFILAVRARLPHSCPESLAPGPFLLKPRAPISMPSYFRSSEAMGDPRAKWLEKEVRGWARVGRYH